MKETTAKERVLKNIRNALMHKNENPYFDIKSEAEVYSDVDPIAEVAFAEALNSVGGNFIYCDDERHMIEQLSDLVELRKWDKLFCLNKELSELISYSGIAVESDAGQLQSMKVGVTLCEYLIARLGSVLVSASLSGGRRMNFFPETHIVVAYASQVVPDIKDALIGISNRYKDNLPSMLTLITGPSRTADIEKTLVMGAHGPKNLIVFLIDDQKKIT